MGSGAVPPSNIFGGLLNSGSQSSNSNNGFGIASITFQKKLLLEVILKLIYEKNIGKYINGIYVKNYNSFNIKYHQKYAITKCIILKQLNQ